MLSNAQLNVVSAPADWWRLPQSPEEEEEGGEKRQASEEMKKVDLHIRGEKVAFLLYNVLSEAECQHLIAKTEAMGYRPMPEYDKNYRSNTRIIIDDHDLTQEIWRRVEPFVPATWSDRRGDWTATGLNPRWRFCRYTAGQHFSSHTDGCFEKSVWERSQLTLMLYLSSADSFGGGATVFLEGSKPEVNPVAGMALIFQHNIVHKGNRVDSGKKFIMRSDVMYRRNTDPAPQTATADELRFYDEYGL